VLVLWGVALAEAPAPFEKAKGYALSATPDSDGNYLLVIERNREGNLIKYVLAYLPRYKIIGVGEVGDFGICIFQYQEDTGEFSIFYNGYIVSAPDEKIIDAAFKVFHDLVEFNAL
jgi:nitrate reductase NapE component